MISRGCSAFFQFPLNPACQESSARQSYPSRSPFSSFLWRRRWLDGLWGYQQSTREAFHRFPLSWWRPGVLPGFRCRVEGAVCLLRSTGACVLVLLGRGSSRLVGDLSSLLPLLSPTFYVTGWVMVLSNWESISSKNAGRVCLEESILRGFYRLNLWIEEALQVVEVGRVGSRRIGVEVRGIVDGLDEAISYSDRYINKQFAFILLADQKRAMAFLVVLYLLIVRVQSFITSIYCKTIALLVSLQIGGTI